VAAPQLPAPVWVQGVESRFLQRCNIDERLDSDTQLMLGFQAGDEACFEKLVERNKQRVFALVFRFLGGHQDAEDVAQEVFLRVYRARSRYQPTAKFTTWLYVICRNTCFKQLEKHRRHAVSLPEETASVREVAQRHVPDARTPSPLDSLLLDERARLVRAAIASLPASQRMALILSRYDGLPYAEIAEAMGCSDKAVKSLLHRARMNVKARLAHYFEKEARDSEPWQARQGLHR
jgi:RNA polymerase sigma-70 factor (ECF subfamily)